MRHAPRQPGPAAARPSGHVIGIDMPAALKIGAVREFDLAVLLELLRLPRRVWSRRCVAIEFDMTGLDQPSNAR